MSTLNAPRLLRQLEKLNLKFPQRELCKTDLALELGFLINGAWIELNNCSGGPSKAVRTAQATFRIARYVIDAEELETI